MFVKYFLLASTLFCGTDARFGSMKNVTVTGRLYCGYSPMSHVIVELWEDDTFLRINRDDKLNVTQTDYNGRFRVYGQKKEIFSIEPYILIRHKCRREDDPLRCDFTDRYDISKQYVGKTYDIGLVELGPEREGRKKSCK